MKNKSHPLKNFLILWRTQSVSQLGSSITAFALTLWLYGDYGFFFKHSCTYHMLLCTLCIDEHLCRSADRPIGQKEDHACL